MRPSVLSDKKRGKASRFTKCADEIGTGAKTFHFLYGSILLLVFVGGDEHHLMCHGQENLKQTLEMRSLGRHENNDP